jgi:hypothetical protein
MMRTVGKGGYGTYFIFGSFCLSMFLFTWFFIPETKGMSLEKMDELFGMPAPSKVIDEERAHESTSIHEKDAQVPKVQEQESTQTVPK